MAIILAELNEDVETLTEKTESGVKNYAIQGIFMQSEAANRNGRIYPKHLMEREVNKYITEKVNKNQALGELNHPLNRVNVDPRESSHLIKELKFDGNDVRGVAKILDTPCGKIVKALMDENVSFGVKDQKWDLLTSLDRFYKLRKDDIRKIENNFLREFQRRYHNYSPKILEKSNRIEWWALMQHYGTPTRLLDCTYSFYVAVLFALEDIEN